MKPVFERATIDAPRERVYELLCDLSLRPAFTDHFQTDYRLGRVDPVGPGAAARFRLHDANWLDTVIERTERPHLVREAGRGGRGNRTPVFTVWELAEGASPDSCELSLTYWTEPPGPFDRVYAAFGALRPKRRDWRRALARLKRVAESGERIEPVEIGGGDRLPAFVV